MWVLNDVRGPRFPAEHAIQRRELEFVFFRQADEVSVGHIFPNDERGERVRRHGILQKVVRFELNDGAQRGLGIAKGCTAAGAEAHAQRKLTSSRWLTGIR